MYGRTMGSLDVKLELSDGRAWLIFLEKGDQGKDWKKGQGNIDIPTGFKYRVKREFPSYLTLFIGSLTSRDS